MKNQKNSSFEQYALHESIKNKLLIDMIKKNIELQYSDANYLQYEAITYFHIDGFTLFIMGFTDRMIEYSDKIVNSFISPNFDRMSYDWVVTSLLNVRESQNMIIKLKKRLKKSLTRLYFTQKEMMDYFKDHKSKFSMTTIFKYHRNLNISKVSGLIFGNSFSYQTE